MSQNFQKLKDAAAGLSSSERVELVRFLLDSLDNENENDVRAEWLAIADERMAEFRAGRVVGIPAEVVLQDLLGECPLQ
jgi:putative addiction module component (TIGR02574 family)